MAGYYGADVAQLRALGMRFDHAADEIDRAGRVLAAALGAAGQWQGPDATTFRGAWGTAYHPRLTGAASALRSAARTVRANADQQQAASRPDGGAGAARATVTEGAVFRSCTVRSAEAVETVRRALDTGGLGVTRSDLATIYRTLDALDPDERADVVAALTPAEIGVLRDQMQESQLRGGWRHSEQAAFYRLFRDQPEALQRLLGDDWPERRSTTTHALSSAPSEFLADVVASDPGAGRISIYETDDGKYVVNLRGIEDGAKSAMLLPKPGVAFDERNQALENDSPRATRWATQSIGDDANWSTTWENPYAVQVRLALQEHGVPPGADVMLVGHSYGAYTAMELASDTSFNGGYVNVKTVVAMAADVDFRMDDMPAGTTGLVLNNANDLVAGAESLLRQNEASTPAGWSEVTFDDGRDVIGHGEGNYSTHISKGLSSSAIPAEVADFAGSGRRTDYVVHDIFR